MACKALRLKWRLKMIKLRLGLVLLLMAWVTSPLYSDPGQGLARFVSRDNSLQLTQLTENRFKLVSDMDIARSELNLEQKKSIDEFLIKFQQFTQNQEKAPYPFPLEYRSSIGEQYNKQMDEVAAELEMLMYFERFLDIWGDGAANAGMTVSAS